MNTYGQRPSGHPPYPTGHGDFPDAPGDESGRFVQAPATITARPSLPNPIFPARRNPIPGETEYQPR